MVGRELGVAIVNKNKAKQGKEIGVQ